MSTETAVSSSNIVLNQDNKVKRSASSNSMTRPGRPTEDLQVTDSLSGGPSHGANAAEDETKYPTGIRFWLIIFCNALVLVFMGLDTSIVSTAVPHITDDFHTVADVGWYSSALRLCSSSFAFMFGKTYTLFPLRPVFLSSLAIFMCGSLLSATAPSSMVFVVSRAICGFGQAGVIQGCFYMLTHLVPLRKRPRIAGALGGIEAVASIAAPSLGGIIVGNLSWRWCFWINLPIGALSFAIIAFALKLDQDLPALSFWQKIVELDLVGNALFVPSLTCLFLAFSWAGTAFPWNSAKVISLFMVFAVLLAGFAYLQYRRGDKATLPARIVTNRSVLAGALFAACTNSVVNVFEYYLPTYFQTIREYTPAESGYLMLPCLLGYLIATVSHGAAVTSIGYYVPLMLFASTTMPIFAGLMTTFTTSTTAVKVAGYSAAMGFAGGIGFQGPQSAVQTVLSEKDASLGLSVIIFAQNIGPAVSIAAAQTIFLSRLGENLRVLVPDLDSRSVDSLGLSDIKTLVGEANLEMALGVFDTSLMQTWYLAVGLACLTMLGSLTMEWRSVKDKKKN
ncbi:hypothetical protein N0V82_002741 [Gnomoniopsis sp. IMI 355080]|nr:hypothetical protein N0V82_002741 [Gnomoniopsis sp. IMI 355080]